MNASTDTMMRRILLVLSLLCAVPLAGCKGKDAAEPSPATAGVAAVAAPAALAAAADNLSKAKALIDNIAGQMEKMVTEIEAAGSDQAKVKAIGEKFKVETERMKAEGEALNKALTDDEKETLKAYGKEKMGPIMGKLTAAMMKVPTAEMPSAAATATPPNSAQDASTRFGSRPADSPCQVVQRYANGDLANWWSFWYGNSGRLEKARDENAGVRTAAKKITPSAEVDAEYDRMPWNIAYSYDDGGHLKSYTRLDNDEKTWTITFAYGRDGKLKGYADDQGPHSLSLDHQGRVIKDDSTMRGLGRITNRREYADSSPPNQSKVLVFGNGTVYFGESDGFLTFPGRPELKLLAATHDATTKSISRLQTFGISGAKGDYYEFRYDCSTQPL